MHGKCKVNKVDVRFLSDTGSELSILSDRVCKKLKIEPKKPAVQLSNADGNDVTTHGNVKVEVEINNEKNVIETVVVENLVNELILGLDALEKFKEPKCALEGIKAWTSSTVYRLGPGKFGYKSNKTNRTHRFQPKSSQGTCLKETQKLLKAVDVSKFGDKWCKEALTKYVNKKDAKKPKIEPSEESLFARTKYNDPTQTEGRRINKGNTLFEYKRTQNTPCLPYESTRRNRDVKIIKSTHRWDQRNGSKNKRDVKYKMKPPFKIKANHSCSKSVTVSNNKFKPESRSGELVKRRFIGQINNK
jgi:hypothetical protein